MFESYAIGTLGIVLLSLMWLGIQRVWSRVFSDAFADPDVLAERIGCGGCDCTNPCERPGPYAAASNWEDPS